MPLQIQQKYILFFAPDAEIWIFKANKLKNRPKCITIGKKAESFILEGRSCHGHQCTTQKTDPAGQLGRRTCCTLWGGSGGAATAARALCGCAGTVRAVFRPRAAGAGVLCTRAGRVGRQPHGSSGRLWPCGGGHAGSGGGGGPQHGWLCAGQVPGLQQTGCH